MAVKKVVAKLEHAKETKGTHQYKEDADDPLIKTLYLPKKTLAKMGVKKPEDITLVVSLDVE